MSEEEIIFVCTIYGEAAGSSEIAWETIASVIMNRVSSSRWEYTTPVDIIKYTGFDAYRDRNAPYITAEDYFKNRNYENEKT